MLYSIFFQNPFFQLCFILENIATVQFELTTSMMMLMNKIKTSKLFFRNMWGRNKSKSFFFVALLIALLIYA
jgi:hypothetical protein